MRTVNTYEVNYTLSIIILEPFYNSELTVISAVAGIRMVFDGYGVWTLVAQHRISTIYVLLIFPTAPRSLPIQPPDKPTRCFSAIWTQ